MPASGHSNPYSVPISVQEVTQTKVVQDTGPVRLVIHLSYSSVSELKTE
jgi:hypothetical protein